MTRSFGSWALAAHLVGSLCCSPVAGAADAPVAPKTADAPWVPGDPVVAGGVVNERGAEIFGSVCAACHAHATGRAPAVYILKIMTPSSIYGALTTGAMRVQAQNLSDDDKKAVVEYLAGDKIRGDAKLAPPVCQGTAAVFDWSKPPAFTDWGLTLTNTRHVASREAGLDAGHLDKLKLKWAVGFDGAVRVRSQPAVVGGAIVLGSQDGTVYALDENTGCVRWEFHAAAEVRTGIVASAWTPGDKSATPLLFFGDIVGNVYAIKAASGRLAWRDHTETHPSTTLTATPAVFEDRLYVPVSSLEEGVAGDKYDCCTFRGSVIAYDARHGRRLWQQYLVGEPTLRGTKSSGTKMYGPSGIAIWNTPAIDAKRGALYIGTGDNYSSPTTDLSDSIVAMDLRTGRIKWSYQTTKNDAWNAGCVMTGETACPQENGPDNDLGAATILATAKDGRQYILAGSKSGWAFAVDPDTGKLQWKTKVGRGGIVAGIYFGMAVRGDSLFVPINDAEDGRHYDEAPKPGLYALDLHTGKYLWSSPTDPATCKDRSGLCAAGIAAPVTVTDDLVLVGGSDGQLRFYSADSGRVVWQYDTLQEVKTVGGGMARGGSLGGSAGLIAYDGIVIAESGYGFAGRIPGNVMLVFGTH